MNENDLNIPPVGENLKRERLLRHLSQGALAEKSGISKAMLSQIESGSVNPTLLTLLKIAHAMDMDIAVLIDGKAKKMEKFNYIPKEQQSSIKSSDGKLTFNVLTAPAFPKNIEMYLIHISPKTIHHSEAHAINNEEYVWVTKGLIEVKSGINTAILKEGDFIAYQGDLEHSFENIGDDIAELNMICYQH